MGSFIEEIEDQMKDLNEKHASAILERRIADNNDEMVEIGASVKAAMTVLKQGSNASVIAAATSAALAASASIRQQAQPVKLDELGRDENLQKRMEAERRAAARQKRRARFENIRASAMEIDGSTLKIEGESSTDESDSETSAYKEIRDKILQCADKVFSDASEEYSQLSRVKERFEKWKRDYASTYRDAYMSLTVPSIFSPYVRLELLKWDPLHQEVDFFDMECRPLQPVVDCILTLRKNLEKRFASRLDDAETVGLARRMKRILVELHEHDHARQIVRTFNLKEAV